MKRDETNLAAWMRQHDPATPVSVERLVRLESRIMATALRTPQSAAERLPWIWAQRFPAAWGMGATLMLVLGLFVGQWLQVEIAAASRPASYSLALATPWQGW